MGRKKEKVKRREGNLESKKHLLDNDKIEVGEEKEEGRELEK